MSKKGRMECLLLVKDNSIETLRILRFINFNITNIKMAGLFIKVILIRAASLDQDMVDTLRRNGFEIFPTFIPCEPGLKDSPLTNFESIKKYLLGHMKRAELMRVGRDTTFSKIMDHGGNGNLDLSEILPNYSSNVNRNGRNNGISIRSGGRISSFNSGSDPYSDYQDRQIMAEGGLGKIDDDVGIGEDDFGRKHQEKMTAMQEKRIKSMPSNRKPSNSLNNMMQTSFASAMSSSSPNFGGKSTIGNNAPFSIPQARGLSAEDDLNEDDNIKFPSMDKIDEQLLDKNETYHDNNDDFDMKSILLDTPLD
jgi:hypothetical protein